jgi:hypothetical protein
MIYVLTCTGSIFSQKKILVLNGNVSGATKCLGTTEFRYKHVYCIYNLYCRPVLRIYSMILFSKIFNALYDYSKERCYSECNLQILIDFSNTERI